MKRSLIIAAFAAALGVAFSGVSYAQQRDDSGSGLRLPHQSGFWGYSGFSFGRSKLDAPCPAGFACDEKDQAFRFFGGGRFNRALGLEFGVQNFGKFQRGGGDTEGWGFDASLVAGVPFGENSGIFGKLGTVYSRTEVGGLGLRTGKERGWGPRVGIAGQLGLTANWALRADLDRYRIHLPGSKEDVDTFTLGVQYTSRP